MHFVCSQAETRLSVDVDAMGFELNLDEIHHANMKNDVQSQSQADAGDGNGHEIIWI